MFLVVGKMKEMGKLGFTGHNGPNQNIRSGVERVTDRQSSLEEGEREDETKTRELV